MTNTHKSNAMTLDLCHWGRFGRQDLGVPASMLSFGILSGSTAAHSRLLDSSGGEIPQPCRPGGPSLLSRHAIGPHLGCRSHHRPLCLSLCARSGLAIRRSSLIMRPFATSFAFLATFVAGSAVSKAKPLKTAVTVDVSPNLVLDARQCTTATAVAVTFNELVATSYGQSVVITGSISQLGSWNPADGIQLSASQYLEGNPLWSAVITLPAGVAFSYIYVRINTDGSYDWEADPDRMFIVPSGCFTAATESDTWHTVSSMVLTNTSPISSSDVKTTKSTIFSVATSTSMKTIASATQKSRVTSSTNIPSSSPLSKGTTSSRLSTSASKSTTKLPSASLTSGTTATTSTCTNSPSSRRCWNSGLSIDTDFDKKWPDTGVTRNYHLTITNITLAPDGTKRQVFAINGQYPGPTIYAE
nr:glucoamylase [Quercus suber]